MAVVVLVTQLCLTLCDSWTHQAPLFMELSRQEYWSGLPCPPSGVLPDPETEPGSPALQANFLPSEPPEDKLFGNHLQKDHVLSPMNT